MTTPPKSDYHIFDHCNLFSEVLGAIETGIIIIDLETAEILYENAYAIKILENVRVEPSFGGLYALLQQEIDALALGGGSRSPKKKIRSGHRLFGYTLYALGDERRHLAVFIQDITDQKRLEAIDEASEMMNNIGFLFSGIRHEIGNPINSIKMALAVLRKNVANFSQPELEKYYDRIFGEIGKMEVLLNSLKTFNLFEKPRPTVVDFAAFFDEFVRLLGMDSRRRQLAINVRIDDGAGWVNVDARALQHVIMNIFANAMDAMADQPEPSIEVRCQSGGEFVVLTISDNGCGIDPKVKQDIFKPFFTTKPQGTGLGLMLSRKMLAQMNCSMEIADNDPGPGVTVTLLLPNAALDAPAGNCS